MSGLQQRFSRASYERLKQELENLKAQRGAVIHDIKEAREMGDLRENFAYHDAKNRQGLLEARIAMLETRLADAIVVEEGEAEGEVVMGVPVTVRNASTQATRTYVIVTEDELDHVDGGASVDSPIGQALVGKMIGDVVDVQGPHGVVQFEVLAIGE